MLCLVKHTIFNYIKVTQFNWNRCNFSKIWINKVNNNVTSAINDFKNGFMSTVFIKSRTY